MSLAPQAEGANRLIGDNNAVFPTHHICTFAPAPFADPDWDYNRNNNLTCHQYYQFIPALEPGAGSRQFQQVRGTVAAVNQRSTTRRFVL